MIADLRNPLFLNTAGSAADLVGDADPLRAAFRFELPAGPNWFSAGMYAVHGYRSPAGVVAGPRLLLAHAHPERRAAFTKLWRRMLAGAGPVTLRYRVVGADAVTRPVLMQAGLGVAPERDGIGLRIPRTGHHHGRHAESTPISEIGRPRTGRVIRTLDESRSGCL